MSNHQPRKHWAKAIQERVWTLVQEGRTVQAAIDQIEAETGERIPPGTAGKWISDRRTTQLDPGDRSTQIAGLAERTLELLSRELAKMERAPRKALDLERLDKIARALRALDTIHGKRRPSGPRSLTELTAGSDVISLWPNGHGESAEGV